MASQPSQSLGNTLPFLLLSSLLVRIHCVNISLVNIPLVAIPQQIERQGYNNTCIEERKQNSCGGSIFYPAKKAFRQKHIICFTDTNQSYLEIERYQSEPINARDCEILSIQDAVNMSCSLLRSSSRKIDDDQTFMLVELRCSVPKQQKLCLIFHNSSVERNEGVETCKKTDNQTGSAQEDSFLDYLKKHVTLILGAVGGILLIIIAVLAYRVRKLFRETKKESSVPTPEVVPTSEDSVYHEPNNHTYIDIDEASPTNYAYAYGHLKPLSPGTGKNGPSEKQDYVNIEQLPDGRENKDYINVVGGDTEYIDMKGSYQPLDRSSMVNDDTMYQGLVEQNGQVRPKIAPKPRHLPRVDESCEMSYLKVL